MADVKRDLDVLWKALRNRPDAREFDPATTVVYGVPLPRSCSIALSPESTRSPRTLIFQRSLWDLLGLRPVPRLYILGPQPLVMFERPTLAVVFESGNDEPRFLENRSHLFINGEPFPFAHGPSLQRMAIHNGPRILYQEEPRIPVPGEKPPVLSEEEPGPPLAGPFPPEDPENPEPGAEGGAHTPPTDGSGCKPLYLFFGLCFQNPLAPQTDDIKEDPLFDDVQSIANYFYERGYDISVGLAGSYVPRYPGRNPPGVADIPKTVDEMFDGLKKAIDENEDYCNCPEDQLVILIAAHGSEDHLLYMPTKDSPQRPSYADVMAKLAAIPKIAAHPEKVYLILLSCHNGSVWDGKAFPTALLGMHVITSTTEKTQTSGYRDLRHWVRDVLRDKTNKTWTDFVKGLKRACANDPKKKSPAFPLAGTVKGCRAKVILTKVAYAGDDVRSEWSYRIAVETQITSFPVRTLKNGSSETLSAVLYDYVIGPCGGKFKLYFQVVPKNGAGDSGDVDKTFEFTCDGTTQSQDLACDVTSGTKKAVLTFSFQVKTQC